MDQHFPWAPVLAAIIAGLVHPAVGLGDAFLWGWDGTAFFRFPARANEESRRKRRVKKGQQQARPDCMAEGHPHLGHLLACAFSWSWLCKTRCFYEYCIDTPGQSCETPQGVPQAVASTLRWSTGGPWCPCKHLILPPAFKVHNSSSEIMIFQFFSF